MCEEIIIKLSLHTHTDVSTDEDLAALMSFRKGSAGSIDGLKLNNFNDLTCRQTAEAGRLLIQSLHSLCDV